MLRPTTLFLSSLSRYTQNFRYSIKMRDANQNGSVTVSDICLRVRTAPNTDHNVLIEIGVKPLGNLFFHPRVQFLMKKLTVVDYDKIFNVRKMGKPLTSPVYTFMTDKELQEEQEKIRQKAEYLLQMPPLIDATEDTTEVLSNDTSLDGFDPHHSKIIFTDISFDANSYERVIVVREPNGLLRTANKDERHRTRQLYFPVEGRQLYTPKMFEPEYLQGILHRGDYEFVLDRACVQFQPHEEIYHSILEATFECVNEKCDFEKLIKTRHFGPLAFYLAANKKIRNMLQFFLDRDKLMEASFLVNLHHIVHSESPRSAEDDEKYEDVLSLDGACKSVKDFISEPSNRSSGLEPTFSALMQKIKHQEEVESEL